MDPLCVELNELLVDAYRSITKIEEQMLKRMTETNLSISELHLIEAIGEAKDSCSVSCVARKLGITLPSATVAINKLAKKGYAKKTRCREDGRVVRVELTETGNRINLAHHRFHEQMVRKMLNGFSDEERYVLLDGIRKLRDYFNTRLTPVD